jgi:hypothetical protein
VIIRLAAASSAVVLFGVSFVTTPILVVGVPGMIGLFLAAAGIATLWRWPITAAAGVFATDYALALWVAKSPVRVVGAAVFGLALLLLLQSVELARCARHATVDAGVMRSQIVGWTGFVVVTLGTTMLIMVLARGVAEAIPFTAAPLMAAAGALGVVLALALALTRVARRG